MDVGADPHRSIAARLHVNRRTLQIALGVIYQEDRPTLEDRTSLPQAPIAKLDLGAGADRYAPMLAAYR